MSPKDEGARRRAAVAKLLEQAIELHEKQQAVLDEIGAIVAGKPGIGAKMKQLEKTFAEAWGKRYAKGDAKAYLFTHKEDGPNMRRIILAIGIEEACRRAVRFVASGNEFYTGARHPFRIYVRDINQLAGEGELLFVDDDDVAGEVQRTASRRRALHS